MFGCWIQTRRLLPATSKRYSTSVVLTRPTSDYQVFMSFVPRTSKKPTLSARETKSKYFQVQTASNSTTTSTTLSDREAPPAIALSAATERKSNSHAQKSGNSTELHTSVKKGGEATSAESLVWTPATVNPSPIPDILARSLDVIFCGINPGMKSAEKGCSYAGPGNHFWYVADRFKIYCTILYRLA